MPYDSPVAAALALYDTLSASAFPGSARPPVYFGEAPAVSDAGTQLRPPYVVVKDQGDQPGYDLEYNAVEEGTLEVEAYAATLADADAIMKAIRFNGQIPSARAGFDFGTLALNPPWYFLALVRRSGRRFYAGQGVGGVRVHGVSAEYHYKATLRATG